MTENYDTSCKHYARCVQFHANGIGNPHGDIPDKDVPPRGTAILETIKKEILTIDSIGPTDQLLNIPVNYPSRLSMEHISPKHKERLLCLGWSTQKTIEINKASTQCYTDLPHKPTIWWLSNGAVEELRLIATCQPRCPRFQWLQANASARPY